MTAVGGDFPFTLQTVICSTMNIKLLIRTLVASEQDVFMFKLSLSVSSSHVPSQCSGYFKLLLSLNVCVRGCLLLYSMLALWLAGNFPGCKLQLNQCLLESSPAPPQPCKG